MAATSSAATTLLRSLPLPPSSLALLAGADFATVGDLAGYSAAELAAELSVDEERAASLLLLARSGGLGADAPRPFPGGAPSRSALSLLEEERTTRRVITFARELDDLLDLSPQYLSRVAFESRIAPEITH